MRCFELLWLLDFISFAFITKLFTLDPVKFRVAILAADPPDNAQH